MTTEQANIADTILQIAAEAATAVVQAMAMASAESNQGAQSIGP